MKSIKQYGQDYVNWVLRLGRGYAAALGFVILAALAIVVQILLSLLFTGRIDALDLVRSIIFGLITAPFVIYFFNALVDKLARSRLHLEQSLKDISRLREQDARLNVELEQQTLFLRSFFDASPDLIFYRNEQGQFLHCNRAMELLTGKTEAELVQLTVYDIYPPETAKIVAQSDKDTFNSNTAVIYEKWLRYPNNKLACFEILKVPYYDRVRNQHCIMGFGRDITERKRYQDVIEKNSRDKSTLMATISHELRTPLNGIIGLSQILLEGNLAEQQKEYLKTINISAISLGHIFSDIIDLEKIDSRRIELFRTNVEFFRLINDISHFANLMAEKKQIQFQIDYADDLPQFISVDNARLSQILWNLVNNAVKFTPEKGSITLKVKRLDHDHFSFSLTDSGIGIAKEEQRKIFAMFYQVANPHGKKAPGSGIGLAISKRIAKLMGGDLTVESAPNCGSTFTLTIQAELAQASKPLPIIRHALRVLLVEDIDVNVVVAKAMLEKFGCQVDVAMTGKAAFALFEQHSYDLVLLDIQLPDTTGTEMAQQWRARYEQGELAYLPLLVALTANIIHTKDDYQQQGMDDVLRKPLSLAALAECLNEHFGDEISRTDEMLQKNADFSPAVEPETASVCFDEALVQELIGLMGKALVQQNLQLFSQLMPEYMQQLEQAYQQWLDKPALTAQREVAKQAHKIKGALAAVGLSRLQQFAQAAQDDTDPTWAAQIAGWIRALHAWKDDAEALRAWIAQR